MNKNFIYYGAATFISQLFIFSSLFLYTYKLKPEIYAVVAVLESSLLILQSIVSGALDRGAQRFFVEKDPEIVISTSTTIALVFSIIFFPLIAFFVMFFSEVNFLSFALLYSAAIGYSLNSILLVNYQFKNLPFYYFLTTLLRSFLFFLFSTIFLFHFESGSSSFLYSSALTGFVLIILSFLKLKPRIRYLEDTAFIKEISLYSLPFLPTLIASWVMAWSNRFFMIGNIPDKDIGIFSASQKMAMVFFLFTQAVSLVSTPLIFNALKINNYERVNAIIFNNLMILIFCSLGIVFFVPGIFSLIADTDYGNITEYLTVLVFVNLVSGVMGISTNLFFAFYKKTLQQMFIFLTVAFLSILFNIFLIREYQINGLYISLIAPMVLLFCMHFYYATKKISFNFQFSPIFAGLIYVLFIFFIHSKMLSILNALSLLYLDALILFLTFLGMLFFYIKRC